MYFLSYFSSGPFFLFTSVYLFSKIMVNSMNDILTNADPDDNYFNELIASDNERYFIGDTVNVDQFGGLVSGKIERRENLLVLSWNIRSFFKHKDELISMMHALSPEPDILILTETWLENSNRLLFVGWLQIIPHN